MATHRRFMYLPSAVLICMEAASFLGAFLLGAAITVAELSIDSVSVAAVAYAVASLVSMSSFRLYTARRSSFPSLLLRIGLALGMAVFLSSQLYDFVPKLAAANSVLTSAAIITFVTVVAIRVTFDCIRDLEERQRIVLVLGAGRRAADIACSRRLADRQGFIVMGYVATSSDQFTAVSPRMVVDVQENMLAYCQRHGVEEIVVAVDNHRHGFPLTQVNRCRDAGIAIIGVGAFLERETGGIRLDALERGPSASGTADDRSVYRPDVYPSDSITQID
jgi:FlaA1/EpsC-like NDP-sugar epimerase